MGIIVKLPAPALVRSITPVDACAVDDTEDLTEREEMGRKL